MKYAFVLASDGTRLMPTPFAKARKLINKGKATIKRHNPFTIQLLTESKHYVQPIELGMDTGSEHIGVSVKSKKHEYIHAQFDNLSNEKERHKDQAEIYRKGRRNRLRYRKKRFNNRKKSKGWLAPTVLHKKENHVHIAETIAKVCPINKAVLEVGQFDTAQMRANDKGETLQGKDYQHGPRYGLSNKREAVFYRDNYTCRICGRTIKDKAKFRAHHNIHRSKGGSDSVDNLVTVCTNCHTKRNHDEGMPLESGAFGKLPPLKDAAFMNQVRWKILEEVKEKLNIKNIQHTYGSYTKVARRALGKLPKTHANDAYAMGKFHPKHRTQETLYKKRRRNNRCMQRFYDAKYIDSRDGSIKSGSQIGSKRTKRSEKRNSEKNERIYRLRKVSKGRITTKRQRYFYQAGDKVKYIGSDSQYKGKIVTVKATITNGKYIQIEEFGRSFSPNKLKPVKHVGGWKEM